MRGLTTLLIAVGSAVVGAGLYSVIGHEGHSTSHDVVTVSQETHQNSDKIIVAKSGKITITQAEILQAYTSLGQNAQNTPIDQAFPVLLEQLLNTKLLNDAALNAVDQNSDIVQSQLRQARDQIVQNQYLNSLVDGELSEEKLQATYKALVTDTPEVEQIRARHILVKEEAEAIAIIKTLKKDTDFAKLAQEKSVGPSASNGGDLGYFARTDMVPAFAEAAFNLAPGKTSTAPVQTQFGWHIIKVEEKRTQPKPSFEEARQALETRIRGELVQANITALRENSEIIRYNFDGSQIGTLDQENK